MKTHLAAGRRLGAAGAAALLLLGAAQGCTSDLLQATDPDLIFPADLESPDGAAGLRTGALARLRDAMGGGGGAGESPWLYSGLLVDEYTSSSTFAQNDETDKRSIQSTNSIVTSHFRDYHRVRTAANQAILHMRKWLPANKTQIAELFFARGMAEMSLAQDFCSGVPLSEIVGSSIHVDSVRYGAPLPTQELFRRAAATFDTALQQLPADSATAAGVVAIRNAVLVGRARARLSLGQFTTAADSLNLVPTAYTYNVTFNVGTGDNSIWTYTTSNTRYAVGDSVEGNARNLLVKNAIPFVSSRDPRVKGRYVTRNSGRDTTVGQDGLTFARVQDRYNRSEPVPIVNGIDARLVEAEAQLKADNPAWLGTLNTLRAGPTVLTTTGTSSAPAITIGSGTNTLPALTDPGTPEARVSLLFRERAFWTFGRGQRLNDLRRLARPTAQGGYARPAEDVFPTGPFHKGGQLGPDMNFPIPQAELNNPVATTCIDRLP